GFPEAVRKRILRGEEPVKGRPGASPPPADFAATAKELSEKIGREVSQREVISYILYPRVFMDFIAHEQQYSDTSMLPTTAFFYGIEPGAEISIEIEVGKTLIVRFLAVGDAHSDGLRTVFFELN